MTNAEDSSALNTGLVAEPWNGGDSNVINALVDSGASRHYFDDALILGLRYKLENYQVLDTPQKIVTTGGHQLDGVAL